MFEVDEGVDGLLGAEGLFGGLERGGGMKLAVTQEERERILEGLWFPLRRAVWPMVIADGLVGVNGKALRCLGCGGRLTVGGGRKCECGGRRVTWVSDDAGVLFVWGECEY